MDQHLGEHRVAAVLAPLLGEPLGVLLLEQGQLLVFKLCLEELGRASAVLDHILFRK